MNSRENDATQSFWEHLDDLRACLIRIVLVVLVLGIAAFLFKEELFAVILGPQNEHFITYRLLDKIGSIWGVAAAPFSVELINTGLARQFTTHMTAAIYAAVLCASPYILYQLFRFVSPALYVNEKKYVVRAVSYSYLLFMGGVLLSYFLIFPLTFRFLGTYQVSPEVANLITLQSYMDTLMTITLMMGVLFEIPIYAGCLPAWVFSPSRSCGNTAGTPSWSYSSLPPSSPPRPTCLPSLSYLCPYTCSTREASALCGAPREKRFKILNSPVPAITSRKSRRI